MDLFSRLGRWSGKSRFDSPLAPETAFFALGDLHGCDALFRRMLDRMDATDHPTARLVTVGDYVDRGDDSRRVLNRLHTLSRAAGDLMICLMGNHERMLLSALDNPVHEGPRWLRHGGLQTLASYGIRPPDRDSTDSTWLETRDRLRAAMGEPLETWLRGLPLLWQTGNVVVVHAAMDPALPPEAQDEAHLLWGHPAFARDIRRDGLWVVHGHTIVDEPFCGDGRVSVDTGAYATGRLTAALVEPGRVDFLTV